MEKELLHEMRQDIKDMRKDITEMKIASAKRDGRLFVVMAVFGTIGGAIMDVVRRKFLG